MRPPSPTQLRFLFVLALVAAVSVGCFRSGSDGPFDATPVARAIPTLTPTHTEVPPTPTETPEPTPEPEDEEDADEFDAFDEFDEASDEDVFEFGLAFPTEDPFEPFDAEGTAVALLEQIDDPTPELDPLILEATQAIIRQTQIFLDQTATAQAVFEVPTETFTPDFFVTATPDFFQPTDVFPPVAGADCVHEVLAGQNLFRLSLLYGVPIRSIAAASGVTNPDFIRVGQRLVIPGCGTTGVRPPPTSVAPSGSLGTSGTAGFPSAGNIRHTVEQGETLFQISLRYGVPMASIAAANGITNFNYIRFNQVLVIP